MDYKESINNVLSKLNDMGFPKLIVKKVYSLDLLTMHNHYNLYLETGGKEVFEWSEDDECYFMIFRQTIDGIPLINTRWENSKKQ